MKTYEVTVHLIIKKNWKMCEVVRLKLFANEKLENLRLSSCDQEISIVPVVISEKQPLN